MKNRYFTDEEQSKELTVVKGCEEVGISEMSYYTWKKRLNYKSETALIEPVDKESVTKEETKTTITLLVK